MIIGRRGVLLLFALGERATWRLLATRPAGRDELPCGQPGPPVPLDELQALLDGAGFGARITHLAWSVRFPLQHRIAGHFHMGHLFVAGDAAHAYSPATGQGMNTGIQDALNLGWKLAFAPTAADRLGLLESYERERLPVSRAALVLTHLAFWAEAAGGPIPTLLRGMVAPLFAPVLPAVFGSRRLVAEVVRCVSQLRVSYCDRSLSVDANPRLCSGPRAGERLGDTTVAVDGRWIRLHALLARPGVHVLLHRDAPNFDDLEQSRNISVHRLTSTPGRGVEAIRPDGYIGYRCGIADSAQLRQWLARIGAAETGGEHVVRLSGCSRARKVRA